MTRVNKLVPIVVSFCISLFSYSCTACAHQKFRNKNVTDVQTAKLIAPKATEEENVVQSTVTEKSSSQNEANITSTEVDQNATENSIDESDFDYHGLEDDNESDNETTVNANGTLIPIDPDLLAFYLYPRKENISYCEEIIYGNRDSLVKSSFNSSNPAVFLIHGFISNHTTRFTQTMKNGNHKRKTFESQKVEFLFGTQLYRSYLEYGIGEKENIIAVDWGKLATSENYTHTEGTYPSHKDLAHDMYYRAAVENVPIAGKRIAEFIMFLTKEGFLGGPSEAHLIGFSLGAHVGGATGMVFRHQNMTLIKRITGADPAGPLYQKEKDVDKMLDPSDASFVDVIHSNQGQDGYYGNEGHVDFMVNGGGPNQPGCQNNMESSTVPNSISGICSHNKSWQLYIRSLVETIPACKCLIGNGSADFAVCRTLCLQKITFGYNCPHSARGNYYVEGTNKESR